MKENLLVVLLVCMIFLLVLALCAKKIGREETLSWAMKTLSPVCIILFYMSGVSIVVPFIKLFRIGDSVVLSSDAIRVAVDSAIVTLFVNTLLSFLSSPIKVEVEARSRQDLEQILVYCNRGSNVEYSVTVSSKYRCLFNWYKKYGRPVLRINNSTNTSLAIDKEEEYGSKIDCSNASKYIDINLAHFPQSGKIYFTLVVQSNKTIKWDDVIKTDFYVRENNKLYLDKLFWQVEESVVKIVHREEGL